MRPLIVWLGALPAKEASRALRGCKRGGRAWGRSRTCLRGASPELRGAEQRVGADERRVARWSGARSSTRAFAGRVESVEEHDA